MSRHRGEDEMHAAVGQNYRDVLGIPEGRVGVRVYWVVGLGGIVE